MTYEEFKKSIEAKWLESQRNLRRTVGLADERFYASVLSHLVDSPTLAPLYQRREQERDEDIRIRCTTVIRELSHLEGVRG